MIVARTTRAVVAVVVVAVIFGMGSASGHAFDAFVLQTLVMTSAPIEAFARDGRDIAWMTDGGRCGYRLQIRRSGAGHTVTINGIVCTPESEEPSPRGDLALADGRALWSVSLGAGLSEYDVLLRTASVDDPRVRNLPCCRVEWGFSADRLPSWALAGSRRLLVYYSHSGYYDAGDNPNGIAKPGTVMRVLGSKVRPLFRVQLPLDIAVDRGRIAYVRRELSRSGCGCAITPRWSPDGTKIAFLRTDGVPHFGNDGIEYGFAEIGVVNLDGTGLTTLTSDHRQRNGLDWSNDATRFVYGYRDEQANKQILAVANADGSAPHEVGFGSDPRWSPSRPVIAFTTNAFPPTISVVNADGSGTRELGPGSHPSWSPDGEKIVFVGTGGGIYVMRSDGSDAHRLVAGRAVDPAWSPDGRTIAYATQGGLYTIGADGSGRRRLTTRVGDAGPDWSPDGRHVVFWSSSRDDLLADEFADSELYVINADGTGLRSPTARRRAEWVTRGELRSATGRVISSFSAAGEPSAVAIAGSLLAVLARQRSGLAQIELFDARSGKLRGEVHVPSRVGPDIAATDRLVVFSVGNTIRALDVRSRATRILTRTHVRPLGLSISGNSVAWAENDTQNRGSIRALSLP